MKHGRPDFRVFGFVGALFAEGGDATVQAMRNIGLGDWTLAETLRIAYAAREAGLVRIDTFGRNDDRGSWRVLLVGREAQ